MKKKFVILFLALTTLLCCIFAFTACNNQKTYYGTYYAGYPDDATSAKLDISREFVTTGSANYKYEYSKDILTLSSGLQICLVETSQVAYFPIFKSQFQGKISVRDGYFSTQLLDIENGVLKNSYRFHKDGTFEFVEAQTSSTISGTYYLENGVLSILNKREENENNILELDDLHFWYIDDGYNIFGGAMVKDPVLFATKSNIITTETQGLEYEAIIENNNIVAYSVTGLGAATDTYIIIPAEHNGFPVTEVKREAFRSCDKILSITIPNSLTKIGYEAFAYCYNLISVKIGSGINEFDTGLFSYCDNLESLKVDRDNKKFHSLYDCIIETESKTLVQGCKNSVIPSDGSVVKIGNGAFNECRELKSIVIPDTIKEIGASAFEECSKLENIYIGNSVETIGDSAFYLCEELKEIKIPDSVIEIGMNAFAICSSVKSIYLGKNVTHISTPTFCSFRSNSIEKITVSNENKTYHSAGNCLIKTETKELILYCKNSIIPSDGSVVIISSIMYTNVYKTADDNWLKIFTIPDCVTKIGNYAFIMCDGLESIVVSANINEIGFSAFDSCINLKTVYFKSSQSDWENIDIQEMNENFINATRYYYSETAPNKVGNYWHYDTDNKTPIKW